MKRPGLDDIVREDVSDVDRGVLLNDLVMPEVDGDPRYHKIQATLSERRDRYICLENKKGKAEKVVFPMAGYLAPRGT